MYEQITKVEFGEIMEQLTSESVWVKVYCDTISFDILYPDFEFLRFKDGLVQLGHREYNEENNYQNMLIYLEDILSIHRDKTLMFDELELILTMSDGINIGIESNIGGIKND